MPPSRRTWLAALAAIWLAAAAPPEIWMAPATPLDRPGETFGSADFQRLFDDAAPWQTVAGHIRVFKLYPHFAGVAPDADLAAIFRFLRRHHIRLALEAGPLTTGRICARNLEGYGGEYLADLARRIKTLGGELAYLAMDEPVFYGHRFDGPDACRSPIADLAADVAANIRALRREAPGVQVGDIEPLTAGDAGQWQADLAQWLAAYRAATGETLAFLHLDLDWQREWADDLRAAESLSHAAGVPFGVIYNAGPEATTDAAWAAAVERHYTAAEAALRHPPDQVLFQSWTTLPTRALPASAPLSATGIVARYLQPAAEIETTAATSTHLSGRLRADALPVAAATLHLEARGAAAPAAAATLSGRVPDGAARALFALRLNAECNCAADARLRLGMARFAAAGQTAERDFAGFHGPGLTTRRNPAGLRALDIDARPDRPMRLNSAPFVVTPGQDFTAAFDLAADPGSERAGYVAVIFLGPDGIETSRVTRRIRSLWRTVATAETDADGSFRIALPNDAAPEAGPLRLRYPGSAALRPAISPVRPAKNPPAPGCGSPC